MKIAYKVKNPQEIQVTMEITMTFNDWASLDEQLTTNARLEAELGELWGRIGDDEDLSELVDLRRRVAEVVIAFNVLETENARLRGLIKQVEWGKDSICPWCDVEKWNNTTNTTGIKQKHGEPCPAFEPDGTVK